MFHLFISKFNEDFKFSVENKLFGKNVFKMDLNIHLLPPSLHLQASILMSLHACAHVLPPLLYLHKPDLPSVSHSTISPSFAPSPRVADSPRHCEWSRARYERGWRRRKRLKGRGCWSEAWWMGGSGASSNVPSLLPCLWPRRSWQPENAEARRCPRAADTHVWTKAHAPHTQSPFWAACLHSGFNSFSTPKLCPHIQKWWKKPSPHHFWYSASDESNVYFVLYSKISWCWCCCFLCPVFWLYRIKPEVSRECPVPPVCVCVGWGLAWESCITVVMSRLAASLIPQQHPALTRPLNKAFDPQAGGKVTACLWLPCLSVCIPGQEPSCHPAPLLSCWCPQPNAGPFLSWSPSPSQPKMSDRSYRQSVCQAMNCNNIHCFSPQEKKGGWK